MTSDYLSKVAVPQALVDISEDDDLSEAVDIQGYRVVGVVTPDTLTGNGTLDLILQVDPDGSGTFYEVMDEAGQDFATAAVWQNVSVDELLQMEIARQTHVVGAQAKLALSAGQAADRTFKLILVAL